MTMSVRHPVFLAAALALGLAFQVGCDNRNGSQSRAPSKDSGAAPTGDKDAVFVATAAQANLAEVDAGRLAAKKTSSADVKRFAQRMIDDHSQAQTEVADLAHKKGMMLPMQTDEAHQKDMARLAEMSGADFDRAYMTMMVNDHVKAVSLFEQNATDASDPEVRAFAKKMLPTLKDHLKMARDLGAKVGASSP
jgi:putative membrane protein